MKKLQLRVDELRVSAFEVLPADSEAHGTVLAHGAVQVGPTGFACPTNGDNDTCRYGSCYSGSPCSHCP